MQIQISSCVSHCQGVSQLQQSVQSNSTVQAVGSAGALAVLLEAPSAPGATSQATGSITQIQLGCLEQCFGTTPSSPSSAALTQLILSQLGSLLAPLGPSGLEPAPGAEQNVVNQVSCQFQIGGSNTTQVQGASQTNATVQIVTTLATPLAPATPQTVDQTQQETWQLQIGCLFYCVDSQQVQQAQQSTTTIQIVLGPAGAAPAAPTGAALSVQQTVWQVQVGCIAWCWDSTQLQQASSESTTTVVASLPTGSGPAPSPGPSPASAPPPTSSPSPVDAPAPAPAPARPPAPAAVATSGRPVSPPSAVRIRLLGSWHLTGRAILVTWSVPTAAPRVVPNPQPVVRVATTRVAQRAVAVVSAAPVARPVPVHVTLRSAVAPVAASVGVPTLSSQADGARDELFLALIVGIVFLWIVRRRHTRR